MDRLTVLAGLLLVLWALQYRWSFRRIRRRVLEEGGDVERLERAMNRRWVRVMLLAAPAVGVLLIVGGLTGAL